MFEYHPYQKHDIQALLSYLDSGARLLGVYYCTGGGKSPLCLGVIARTQNYPVPGFRTRSTHNVIFAPTDVIRSGFSFPSDKDGLVKDLWGTYPMPLLKANNTSALADTGHTWINDASTEQVCAYLKGSNSDREILRSSHAVGRLLMGYLSDHPDITGKVAHIDEDHHLHDDNQTMAFRTRWLECGGSVIIYTATPDFQDKVAFPINTPHVIRTLTNQMATGYAPERLWSEVLSLEGAAENNAEDVMVPVDYERACRSIVYHMQIDRGVEGLPIKAIIRSKNINALLTMARVAKESGLRVFIGYHKKNPVVQDFNRGVTEVLRKAGYLKGDLTEVALYEKQIKDYRESCVDVIIGIQIVLEGFDWAPCSHIYLLGVPREIRSLVQGTGRTTRVRIFPGTTRAKLVGYPEKWLNESKVVLVAAGEQGKIEKAHLEVVARVCSYLSTFRRWPLWKALSKVFEEIPFENDEERVRYRDELLERCQVSEGKSATINRLLFDSREWFGGKDAKPPKVRTHKPLNYSVRVKILFTYMRDVLGGRAHYKDVSDGGSRITSIELDVDGFPTFDEREVRGVLVQSNERAQPVVTEKLEELFEQGGAGAITPEAMNKILEDVAELLEPHEGDDRVQQEMRSMILKLTADNMESVARHLEEAIAPVASHRPGGFDFISEAIRGKR